MPADVLGSEVVDEDPSGGNFPLTQPIFSQVVLADKCAHREARLPCLKLWKGSHGGGKPGL